MKIFLKNFNENVLNFIRTCGYFSIAKNADGEWNCARSLAGRDYPRFHLYIKKEGDDLMVNLHLDQKKPSYAGASAHSGEYEGEVVEKEAKRIQEIYSKMRGN